MLWMITTKIESFLNRKKFLYNIIPNSLEIAKEYKTVSYPTHLVIDKNSKIAHVTSGLSATTISDLDKKIEQLLQ